MIHKSYFLFFIFLKKMITFIPSGSKITSRARKILNIKSLNL
jgi:hypothetical protein